MKNIQKVGFLALAGLLTFSACKKKENLFTETNTLNQTSTSSGLTAVYNRTINYTVLVTNQREGNFRSAEGVAGATVAVAVDGEVKTATTDANGQAVFTGLKYGSAAVSVSAAGHTAAHYIVDFTAGVGAGQVDNHTQRTASTLVKLLPVANLGTAVLRGKLEAERDATSTDAELLPDDAGAALVARVDFNNFDATGSQGGLGFNHNGAGRITERYYEGIRGTQTFPLNNNGSRNYSITIPATAYGLSIEVYANPFIGNFVESASITRTVTYNASGVAFGEFSPIQIFSKTVYPGGVYLRDITYNRQN